MYNRFNCSPKDIELQHRRCDLNIRLKKINKRMEAIEVRQQDFTKEFDTLKEQYVEQLRQLQKLQELRNKK